MYDTYEDDILLACEPAVAYNTRQDVGDDSNLLPKDVMELMLKAGREALRKGCCKSWSEVEQELRQELDLV